MASQVRTAAGTAALELAKKPKPVDSEPGKGSSGLDAGSTATGSRPPSNSARRDARKLETQARYKRWRKKYKDMKKRSEAALQGKPYTYILDKPYRWESWAAPKDKDGKLDHNRAMVGDDLRDFVNGKLFPYLQGFKQKATGSNTLRKLASGQTLATRAPSIHLASARPARGFILLLLCISRADHQGRTGSVALAS